jgi:hypothetical protein
MNILSQIQVGKVIKSIKLRAANVERDIHIVGVSTLVHMRDHGDYTGALALLNALPKGQRVKALAGWYKHNSSGKFHARIDKDTGEWVGKLEKGRADSDFLIVQAEAKSFAELTVEREPVQITEDTLAKYLERIAANDEMLDNGKPKVTETAKARARAMLAVIAA